MTDAIRPDADAIVPPLPITSAELEGGLAAVDKTLEVADHLLDTTT